MMDTIRSGRRFWVAMILFALASCAGAAETDPRNDASPWGIASGAEWSGEYPRFNPMLAEAGVKWLRYFPEWHALQPKPGEWNWTRADSFVANCRENGIRVAGVFAYFAPWASADGGTRRGPVKDMQHWRDYVRGVTGRYQKEIRHWEVWNEFNGSFYQGQDKPKEYAELVVAAYETAKKVDPAIRIGLSVANFDVGFLDAAIKAGAADHFDYIAVHPYENLGAVAEGGEVGYLSLTANLRKMLAANKQRPDIPLWITETGHQAPIKADAKGDGLQAEMLVKAYVLSLAQGFERICWFEARGPAYGHGTDHGIIRPDWSVRPAYTAMKTMTMLLGAEPGYLGWLNVGDGGYGFVFQGAEGPVLAAWAPPGKSIEGKFDGGVTVVNLLGQQTQLAAGQPLRLDRVPLFVKGLPASAVKLAKANRGKKYPWGGDYASATAVTCKLGVTNLDDGLKQVNPQTTVPVNDLTSSCRRTDFADPKLKGEGRYVYFRVDPQFVPYGTKQLQITVLARRVAAGKKAGMNLCYESQANGYRQVRDGYWTIPDADGWQEHTWTLTDANFVGQWGWNFRLDATGSPSEFLVKELRVTKAGSPAR